MNRFLLSIVLSLLAAPAASAHGAMQKIVEGRYLLNLTSVPIAPYAGQKQQNILAISDVATNSLVEKNIIFDVAIHKDNKTVYSARDLVATGGLLQFNYAYAMPGNYELFAQFRIPGNPHQFVAEDYWVQVVPMAAPSGRDTLSLIYAAAGGIVLGYAFAGLGRSKPSS